MNFYKKNLKYIRVLICCIFFSFFSYTAWCGNRTMPESPPERNAWLVYWDASGGAEAFNKNTGKYDSISYFAAYFTDNDQLFLPEGFKLEQALTAGKDRIPSRRYLTVVNDIVSENKVFFKNIDVVKRVLDNDTRMIIHADEIINLAQKNNCNGIDLDYEQIFKDNDAAEKYIRFIKILNAKAYSQNIKLRVILEPSVKFSNYTFPHGPQYVVMMYNLYGLHSGPGPKADFAFIKKTAASMQALPAPVGIAISSGGCLWGENGEKKFISEQKAISLAQEYKAAQKRDDKSGGVYFSYTKDGLKYTVWYADQKTLDGWTKEADKLDIHAISLWRLGDN